MKNLILNNQKLNILSYILFGLVALSVGLYIRLYPLINFTQDDSSEKASVFVINQLRSIVQQRVDATHPDIPEKIKKVIVQKQLDALIKQDSQNVKKAIERVSTNIESSLGKSKKSPYLLASDSFYYYGLTENIIKTGQLGGEIKGSKYLNTKMLAPHGHWEPYTFHPFVGYYIHKILKIFNSDISLMYSVSFTPLVITTLSLIAFIILCAFLNCQPITTFVGSIFFLLAPIFVKRSTFGWYDNDPYNILFPLLIMAGLFYGLKHLKNNKHLIISGLLTILFIILYTMFWQGWVFIFAVIFVSAITTIIFQLIKKDFYHVKKTSLYYSIIAVISFLLVSLFFGAKEFFILFQEGWVALKNFMTPQLSPWPDLYLSVGELKKSSIGDIAQLTGGKFFLTISFFGIVSLIKNLSQPRERSFSPQTFIILTFLLLSFYITLGAQRFILLTLPPLCLLFTIGFQFIIDLSDKIYQKFIKSSSELKKTLKTITIIVLFSTIIIPIRSIQASISTLLNPIYNSTWDKALNSIGNSTPRNSIINTWWPPGHFIKTTAKRSVTFDGATINVPQAYWISNVFLSQDEKQSVGILRMLNNSGNDAAEYLQEIGFDLSISVKILEDITKRDESVSRQLLLKGLRNPFQVEHLLKLTHQTPPPSYCLLYNEFVDNNIQLKFIGGWNFEEIEKINNDPELLANIPKRNSDEYVQFLWKLAGGPYKYSGPLSQISTMDDTVIFQDNLKINTKKKTCLIASDQYGKGIPRSIFYVENDSLVEKVFPNANLTYSVALTEENGRYTAILLDRDLARSMLVRLFFFNAVDLKYFEPFIEESDLTKRTVIKVFKVNWEKFVKDN